MKDFMKSIWQRLGLRGVTLVVIATLFLGLVLQNTDTISLDVLFWEFRVSKIVFFIGLTVFGFAMGMLTSWIRQQADS